MDFFTSPEDLKGWVKTQKSPDQAAIKIMEIIGGDEEQDIVDTCKAIFEGDQEANVDNASKILFSVLAKHNITQMKEGKMNNKLKKEAQIMRQPGQYDMPLRICPKLPYSVGKRLISTYPLRVYCAETLWRRHVMDKFSREWKNDEGKWVGGYINDRFQVYYHDGGNLMELSNTERTRKPRPHQYSIERRLSEGRGEETYDLTAKVSSDKIIKLASVGIEDDDKASKMFSDIINMKEVGLSDEDIISKVAEHYNEKITIVAKFHQVAMKQFHRHANVLYACDHSKVQKTAQANILPEKSTMVTQRDVNVVNVADGKAQVLKIETPVVRLSSGNSPVFEIVDGPDVGQKFKLANELEMNDVFGMVDGSDGTIQDAAEELGLNEANQPAKQAPQSGEDFPITEV